MPDQALAQSGTLTTSCAVPRPSIALIHPGLSPGGAAHVCLSIIQALQDDYRVSLVTTQRGFWLLSFAELNELCGTNVDEKKIALIEVYLSRFLRDRFAALRGALFTRACRRLGLSAKFDVVFNADGGVDSPTPAIQFIHDPAFTQELVRQLAPPPPGLRGLFYRDTLFRKGYLLLSRTLARPSKTPKKNKVTIVNSRWTGEIVTKTLGVEARTIYPPVRCQFPDVPWQERENGFVCVGRWSREKRMEEIIAILAKVRQEGFDLHLHLVGNGGDRSYFDRLMELASANSRWVSTHNHISSGEKADLLSRHRFGISGRLNEPFGIAVAELVKAGCIAFVPNGGGQTEIVNHPTLIFQNNDDAVSKICAVFSSDTLQETLRRHLAKQALKFSYETFKAEIRQTVRDFLNDRDRSVPQYSNLGS